MNKMLANYIHIYTLLLVPLHMLHQSLGQYLTNQGNIPRFVCLLVSGQHRSTQLALLLAQLEDVFVHRARGHELVDSHGFGLTNAMATIL